LTGVASGGAQSAGFTGQDIEQLAAHLDRQPGRFLR
jgi:hypothetical protein